MKIRAPPRERSCRDDSAWQQCTPTLMCSHLRWSSLSAAAEAMDAKVPVWFACKATLGPASTKLSIMQLNGALAGRTGSHPKGTSLSCPQHSHGCVAWTSGLVVHFIITQAWDFATQSQMHGLTGDRSWRTQQQATGSWLMMSANAGCATTPHPALSILSIQAAAQCNRLMCSCTAGCHGPWLHHGPLLRPR